jgi:RHS repeat-associated protein
MAKANPFRFSTKYQDDESDLLYYGYRYYSASTGRWINRDPIEEEGSVNIYCFASNDPNDLYDLLGLLDFKYLPEKTGDDQYITTHPGIQAYTRPTTWDEQHSLTSCGNNCWKYTKIQLVVRIQITYAKGVKGSDKVPGKSLTVSDHEHEHGELYRQAAQAIEDKLKELFAKCIKVKCWDARVDYFDAWQDYMHHSTNAKQAALDVRDYREHSIPWTEAKARADKENAAASTAKAKADKLLKTAEEACK